MARFLKRDRGVTPVVSALLMIVVTVAAFALLYGATDSWIRAQRTGPLLRLKERVVIENVWFLTNATGKYVCVYSRNVGEVEVTIYSFQVGGGVPSPMSGDITLSVGRGGWMNASYSWSVGTTYEVRVLTDRGGEFITHAMA